MVTDDPVSPSELIIVVADNLQRAAGFYERVFECEVETCADDTCRFSLAAIGDWGGVHAIIRRRTSRDTDVTNLFRVTSLDGMTDRVSQQRGRVIIASLAAGNKRLGLCQDTEGNRFAIESVQTSASARRTIT